MNQDQLDQARRIAYLVTGFIRNNLTAAERSELDQWIGESDANMKLFGKLTDQEYVSRQKKWTEAINVDCAEKKNDEDYRSE